MDYHMLKELKRKMDYDNEKRKSSGQWTNPQELLPKNPGTIPKTFSPEHKPMNPKINTQNKDFASISSKLNYVNFDSFFDFKEKIKTNKGKSTYSPNGRQRVDSFHKKNESGTNIRLKQQLITESINSNIKEGLGNIGKLIKRPDMVNSSKLETNSELPLSKDQDYSNISLQIASEHPILKKISHKKTSSFGCNPFSFFDPKVLFSSQKKNKNFKPKEDFSIEEMRFLQSGRSQKSLSIRYISRTQKGFLVSNLKKPNQDSFISVPNIGKNIHQHLFAVCDGHGIHGHLVSNFIKEHLPNCLIVDPNFPKYPDKAFLSTTEHIQKVLESSFIDTSFSGSTLIAVLIQENRILTVNIGDSRAILSTKCQNSWKITALSIDHKPELLSEKERITKKGGVIEYMKDKEGRNFGPLRVWHTNAQNGNNCGIAMTRSIGDKVAKSVGVTWEPEIKHFNIEEEDGFIVLASDGVWEVFSNEECAEMVGKYYEKQDLEGAAEFLVGESMRRWVNIDQNAIDDITCIIVFLAHV